MSIHDCHDREENCNVFHCLTEEFLERAITKSAKRVCFQSMARKYVTEYDLSGLRVV